jgi:ribulose-5-phosphate 4-epimerase/fuculose-1-phosphate aldolase
MNGTKLNGENRECGVRFKFKPIVRDLRPTRHPEMDRLLHWCRVFSEEGLAPVEGGASAGNLSFRTPSGFVITPTRVELKSDLGWDRLVEVVRSNYLDYEVHFLGGAPPSSDAFLHDRIYAMRPDVLAVFHGHDEVVLEKAGDIAKEFDIAVTEREMIFGTREDAIETAAALGRKDYIIRKGHGFVSVGRTLDKAGELAVRIHRFAASLPG